MGVNVWSKLGGKTFGMKILEENLGENRGENHKLWGETTNYGGKPQIMGENLGGKKWGQNVGGKGKGNLGAKVC